MIVPGDDVVALCAHRDGVPRLEVGCGYSQTAGYLHLDINPNIGGLDWCGPAYPLPFADESFVEVRAWDIWEHLPYRDSAAALTEWARVLRPGGRFEFCVPAADEIMRRYVRDPESLSVSAFVDEPSIVSVAWRLLGGGVDGDYAKDGDSVYWNTHLALFSELSIREYARRAGLYVESLVVNPHPNYIGVMVKQP